MKAKKYFLVYVILIVFSPSLARVSVPLKAQEPYVKVYVNQSLGYIPGQPLGQEVTVDIIIEVSGIANYSTEGIVGWGMGVHVYPDVLEPERVRGAADGYFLWEFADYHWYGNPTLLGTSANRTLGYWEDLAEMIIPTPPVGAGNDYSGLKLVTLSFISKNETAHSIIDLIDVDYMTAEGRWHPVDEVIDGHYNQPPPYHNLSVESTGIDGINFIIDITTYTTNATVELEEGRPFTVSIPSIWKAGIDQYIFRHWEDNSTNLVRIVSLTSNKTIMATYELATKNYTLTVSSLPITGINFTVNGTTIATNWSGLVLEGFRTVSMPFTWRVGNDTYIFRHWENNATNLVCSLSLLSNKTITATYELVLVPVASFTFSPTEPIIGETVSFNASASNDPDGTIASYYWHFDDWRDSTGSGAIAEHTYMTSRDYHVLLRVIDNEGLSHNVTKVITVKEAPLPRIPLELYMLASTAIAIIIVAIAVYYLKIRRQKPT